ncbi:hypothetical protein [Tepidibacillus decaturensis]|uniref:Uncharacterized protein n=1 Tax=Tepidibacillus decaturensis TaxID=1413211 RepID=A0A135L4R2_9BACI|nr:hypothetical protein [Tepidibacillus decaturensis]KXG43951.1 hypothetical protein U473_07970 [Tepidibacillus decaturensis]
MKKIITIVLATLLLISLVSPISDRASAVNNDKDIVNEFTLNNVIGQVLNDNWDENDSAKINLKKLSINQNNGHIKTKGEFENNNKLYDLNLSGTIYPVIGQGVYSDKLLLGDMKETKDFIVLQFRIEKDSSKTALLKTNYSIENQTVLTIVLEDKNSQNIIYLQDSIPETIFDTLSLGAKYQLKKDAIQEKDLAKKIVELSNMRNKSSNNKQIKTQEISEEDQSQDLFSITSTQISVDYYELKRLFSDLKTNSTVNLDDYNIPESLFKGSGWKSYVSWSLPDYFYHAYSADQSWYTLTQISMVDIKNNRETGIAGHSMQTEILYGYVVEYDHYTRDIKVFYYDFGLKFDDLELVMNKLTGDHVFLNRNIYGIMASSPSYAKAAVALIPYLSTVSSVWDNIQASESQKLGQKKDLGSLEEQKLENNNSVYYGILGDFKDYYLQDEGHYAKVEGTINGTYMKPVSGYRYTASTNL